MSDLIERAEAQSAIQFVARRYTVAHEAHGAGKVVWSDDLISVTDAMNVLREIPSAQPLPEELYKERRKADSCEGCKNIGLWENEYEYGVSCPCFRCARRAVDNYEPERRTDAAK